MATINSILLEVGKKPIIYKLSATLEKQIEEISALLGGNFVTSRLFEVGEGLSLHIFINDMAVPLRLPANRRFPEPDEQEIIFGNALFLVLEDAKGEEEGPLDIPDHICEFFIKNLEEYFKPCIGNELPSPEAEIFTENQGTDQERRFKWQEVEPPQTQTELKFIGDGYVRIVDDERCDTFEIKGRYFKQLFLSEEKNPQ